MAYKKNYNKEEYKQKKEEEIKAIVGSIEDGIKKFQDSDFFKNYLKVMSKFHRYSFSNSLLIAMQKPEATLVAGFNTWKSQGRTVQKGEHGISILAPCIYKSKEKVEVINPDTKKKEEKEVEYIKKIGFKKVTVFDISQTQGKAIPRLITDLKGDAKELEAIRSAAEEITGVKIQFEDIKGGAKGYYSPLENKIVVKKGMGELHTCKTILHESVHQQLHANMKADGIDRHRAETEAEATAFTICTKLGLDTSSYSFPYLASWASNSELTELKSSMKIIQETAMKFIDKIEEKLKVLEIKKEIENPVKSIEILSSNCDYVSKGEVLSIPFADTFFKSINEKEMNVGENVIKNLEIRFAIVDDITGDKREVLDSFRPGLESGGLKEWFNERFSDEKVKEVFGEVSNKNTSLKDRIEDAKSSIDNKVIKKEAELSL